MARSREPRSRVHLPLSFEGIRTIPLRERRNKVAIPQFAKIPPAGASVLDLIDSLPTILAADSFRGIVDAVVQAVRDDRPVIWGMGAHVIKVGLSPLVIDLMESGVITAVALNGAGVIHDVELALIGETSEDVAANLPEGAFGMVEETATFVNSALDWPADRAHPGYGTLIGKRLLAERPPHLDVSIVAAGVRLGIPVTVHVAVGTDIVHMHPSADGAMTGRATFADFQKFVSIVSELESGVYLNVGSAVILPEVFLKALTVARNLGKTVDHFTTANLDMNQHYRSLENVVRRPTMGKGQGLTVTGHHEIMIPLLAQAVQERLRLER